HHFGHGSFDLDAATNGGLKCLHCEGGSSGFDRPHIQPVIRCRVRVEDDRGACCLERRHAVFEVNPIYIQQRGYFEPLFAEIDGGGAAAMLYDLLRLDLEGWHPRYDIPQTQALVDQKVQSLDGLQQCWLAKLSTGETPTAQTKNPRWVLSKRIYEDVVD